MMANDPAPDNDAGIFGVDIVINAGNNSDCSQQDHDNQKQLVSVRFKNNLSEFLFQANTF
jgi:hypothetical protein